MLKYEIGLFLLYALLSSFFLFPAARGRFAGIPQAMYLGSCLTRTSATIYVSGRGLGVLNSIVIIIICLGSSLSDVECFLTVSLVFQPCLQTE